MPSIASIVVGLILIAIIAFAIRQVRKNGGSCHEGGCSGCAHSCPSNGKNKL